MSRSAFAAQFRSTIDRARRVPAALARVAGADETARGRARRLEKAISEELGYASPAAFSRAFSQVVGASPRAWLNSQNGNGRANLLSGD
ncbi:MAG: AraC family transcriptional regulator [Burkholderiaceae bacterium]